MNDVRRILILIGEAGFGHRSAALAVGSALQDTYGERCRVDVVNPLNDRRTPAPLRESQAAYDKMVRRRPELYSLGYRLSDMELPNSAIQSALTVMLFQVLRNLIARHQPHVIVTTYPLYLAPLDAVFGVMGRRVPVITVVTDLTDVHRQWFHHVSDLCLVPTEMTRALALRHGLPAHKVRVTGIPVHPRLSGGNQNKGAARAELGWRPDLPTVLVVGSRRVSGLAGVLDALNGSGVAPQLAVVTGGDDGLFTQLTRVKWRPVTHLYQLVLNMPTLMQAADCIVCKAGGLITSEALACDLPILLVDVIDGQETGNADYVVSGGAGELAGSPDEAVDALRRWFAADGWLMKTYARNAHRLGRPQAAQEIADLAWTEAERSAQRAFSVSVSAGRASLIDRVRTQWREGTAGSSF